MSCSRIGDWQGQGKGTQLSRAGANTKIGPRLYRGGSYICTKTQLYMYYYVVTGADTKVLGSECKSCRELKFVFKLQALLAVVMFLSLTYIQAHIFSDC